MHTEYQARWISKDRLTALRKAGGLGHNVVLDSFNGRIIIEPKGSELGDGPVLSREEADYELQPVWCPGPTAQLRDARRLLGIDTGARPGLPLGLAG